MYEKFQVLLDREQKTAYRVAKDTGVTTATLTSWKKGKYTPKVNKLKVLADYFGVSVDYFL
ncbi:helix-turn-helix transcriptional regulator [Paenibacillus sp. UMB7766-LJ446]|uniref:helix-turn-helix domain-containing protein n=1 Tax=Paenibacillus sp. UMB7766-LJ446 TaxID=3046313 RepID=UPI00254DB31A|nr:helix-turn-helix transcriptional regulator [Paenibacillus sp. UMB7766-LJ446]MDK8189002.1 helix-turn-helix transcriptional regulator [Paenibacillus sp. UMB7766-LJ446]